MELIPILANANDFIEKNPEDDFNDKNSIEFPLKVKCDKDKSGKLINETIYSKYLIFIPKVKNKKKYYNKKQKLIL